MQLPKDQDIKRGLSLIQPYILFQIALPQVYMMHRIIIDILILELWYRIINYYIYYI